MPDDKKGALKRWLESGEVSLAPLTFPQRELWEASAIAPGDESNHICNFLKVRGPLTTQECLDSVQRVVDRQESLRLSIIPGKDQPLQMIRSTGTPALEFRDVPASTSPEALQEMIDAAFLKKFDLLKGPLYRVEILRHGPNELTMVVALHHAIADGWTLGVFVQDLCQAYLFSLIGADIGLQPVAQSYTAWGAAERAHWTRAELDHRGEYWKKRLAGTPRIWADANLVPARLTRHRLMISSALAQPVRALAKRHGATLFSTLLTAFQVALSRWSGKTDFVVGTPIANRARTEVRSTMGYCSGNVPMRGQVDASRTFSESLITVQQETVDAFANAMPFAELVRSIGEPKTPGRHPVYQVRFALQNHPVPDVDLPELSIFTKMCSTGTARFDLGCEVTEIGEELEVVWLNRESAIPSSEVPELQRLFEKVLDEACRCETSRIGAMV